jgi:autotransporter adhesin
LIAVALLALSSNVFADAKGELTSACSNYNSYKQNDSQGNWNGFVNNVNAAVASNETATKAWQVANSWKTAIENNQFDGYCESDGSNSWKPIVPTTPTNPGGGSNGGSGITQQQLDESQQKQDDKQAAVDKDQDDHINAVQDAAQTANDRATDLEHRADATEGAIRETNDQLAVTDARSIDNATRLDGVEAKNDEQDKAISGKADQAALDKEVSDRQNGDKELQANIDKNKADQAVTDANQNAAIDGKVDKSTYAVDKVKQAVHDAAQDAAIVGLAVTKADKADLNKEVAARKDADKVLQSNIDSEAKTRANADTALKNNIDQNKAEQAKTDAKQDKALSTETYNRISADTALKANIDQNKAAQAVTDSNQDKVIATKASKVELANESTARQKADSVLSSRIDTNDATLVQHDERITSNTQRIGTVEGRVSNLEQSTNKRFNDIDKRIGDNRKVASAGIAGAGAMANIPQVTRDGNFSVGAGIGGYDGEQAVAVGFSARVTNSVTTKVSVSTNTQSEVLWGAGVGVEW